MFNSFAILNPTLKFTRNNLLISCEFYIPVTLIFFQTPSAVTFLNHSVDGDVVKCKYILVVIILREQFFIIVTDLLKDPSLPQCFN